MSLILPGPKILNTTKSFECFHQNVKSAKVEFSTNTFECSHLPFAVLPRAVFSHVRNNFSACEELHFLSPFVGHHTTLTLFILS